MNFDTFNFSFCVFKIDKIILYIRALWWKFGYTFTYIVCWGAPTTLKGDVFILSYKHTASCSWSFANEVVGVHELLIWYEYDKGSVVLLELVPASTAKINYNEY